jgi:7,8-dihydropterin-6-yl-methyl-4-(beta-D-ribofuranosyl)aminobenzene 5'-phosphate synthase
MAFTRLTILCDNCTHKPGPVLAEHGFACLIETEQGSFLFDAGQGLSILNNACSFGKDLSSLKSVILSHGHYDHGGGLGQVLRVTGPIDVFAHPDVFQERYALDTSGHRFVGLPYKKQWIESSGACFRFHREPVQVAPRLMLSGDIARTTPFEKSDPHLVVPRQDGEGWVTDPIHDELALTIETGRGLVVLTGCAHAGLINTLEHVRRQAGDDQPIHAVIGGTHLAPASDEQFSRTLQSLEALEVERIGVCHCTGLERASQLAGHFGERFFFADVGTVFEV